MKILHIIVGLDIGGAEMMLYKFVSQARAQGHENMVICMMKEGPVAEKLRALDVTVHSLKLSRSNPNPFKIFQLIGWIRKYRPQIVQTWMYHSDLLGGFFAKIFSSAKIIWGIHQSNLSSEVNSFRTLAFIRLCSWASRWLPDKIICCSQASYQAHKVCGYFANKMVVIPNAFDTDVFKPDIQAREEVRREFKIQDDEILFGLIGRFDPQKDQQNFIEAAARLLKRFSKAKFLLAGENIDSKNETLNRWIRAAEASSNFLLLGQRNDMPRIMAALDVGVLSSCGEAFPNVLGEMMSCAIPCVTTDVGDTALMLGDAGMIVPPKNSGTLAEAMTQMLKMNLSERVKLGQKARESIINRYRLDVITQQYIDIYRKALSEK